MIRFQPSSDMIHHLYALFSFFFIWYVLWHTWRGRKERKEKKLNKKSDRFFVLGTTNRRQCAANRGPLLPRPAQNTLASALYIMDLSLWTIICCGAGFLFHIYIVASGGCRKERERSFECDVVALLKNAGLIDWRDPVRNRRCRSQGERASREDETLRVCDRCEWIVHLCARSLNGHLNGKGKREMRSRGFPFCGIKWCGRVRAYYYKKTQAAVRVGGCGIKAGNNWPITKLLATPGQWLSREKSSTAKKKKKNHRFIIIILFFIFSLFEGSYPVVFVWLEAKTTRRVGFYVHLKKKKT